MLIMKRMKTCPSCGFQTSSIHCIQCGHQIDEISTTKFPPVTWPEIRDHLVNRLMIDEKWMVEGPDEITWWPWILPQSIYVSSRVEMKTDELDEVGLRITVETFLGTALDRNRALNAVADLMIDYPFGSLVVLDDNRVAALSSVFIYSLSKGMLTLLHEEALIQATFATELARRLESQGVIATSPLSHPTSGTRETPDELVANVYGPDVFSPLVDVSHSFAIRDAVRVSWKNSMLRAGATAGFENDEVSFVTFPNNFDVGVGWRDEEFPSQKFGPSIMVWNNLGTFNEPSHPEALNALNLDLALNTEYGLGHIGGVTQTRRQHNGKDMFTLTHVAQLPTYLVSEIRGTPDDAIINVRNAIAQATAGARFLFSEIHDN